MFMRRYLRCNIAIFFSVFFVPPEGTRITCRVVCLKAGAVCYLYRVLLVSGPAVHLIHVVSSGFFCFKRLLCEKPDYYWFFYIHKSIDRRDGEKGAFLPVGKYCSCVLGVCFVSTAVRRFCLFYVCLCYNNITYEVPFSSDFNFSFFILSLKDQKYNNMCMYEVDRADSGRCLLEKTVDEWVIERRVHGIQNIFTLFMRTCTSTKYYLKNPIIPEATRRKLQRPRSKAAGGLLRACSQTKSSAVRHSDRHAQAGKRLPCL